MGGAAAVNPWASVAGAAMSAAAGGPSAAQSGNNGNVSIGAGQGGSLSKSGGIDPVLLIAGAALLAAVFLLKK